MNSWCCYYTRGFWGERRQLGVRSYYFSWLKKCLGLCFINKLYNLEHGVRICVFIIVMLISLFISGEIAINLKAWMLFLLVQLLCIIRKQRYPHELGETKKGFAGCLQQPNHEFLSSLTPMLFFHKDSEKWWHLIFWYLYCTTNIFNYFNLKSKYKMFKTV